MLSKLQTRENMSKPHFEHCNLILHEHKDVLLCSFCENDWFIWNIKEAICKSRITCFLKGLIEESSEIKQLSAAGNYLFLSHTSWPCEFKFQNRIKSSIKHASPHVNHLFVYIPKPPFRLIFEMAESRKQKLLFFKYSHFC